MPRTKTTSLDLSVPENIAAAALGEARTLLVRLIEMSIEADKVKDEIRKALDNPIAKTLAAGLAAPRGFKTAVWFDVTTEGDLVLSAEVPVKGPLPDKTPRKLVKKAVHHVKKAAKVGAKKAPTAKEIKAAEQALPEIKKPSKGKKSRPTLQGLYPSVKELRELAAKVGAKIDGIAPQNKKAMLAAIEAVKKGCPAQ